MQQAKQRIQFDYFRSQNFIKPRSLSFAKDTCVSNNLFERTNDVSMLFDAIAFECKAIEAWRLLITAAGDVYVIDLIIGVRNPDLCGHWKDELPALEKGLKHWNRNGLDLNRKKWLPKLGIPVQQQLQRMIACLKSLISL